MIEYLDRKEVELLAILTELLAGGEIELAELRVKVGSQGGELGRAYLRLYSYGLVAERAVRPNILRRLLGGHDDIMVGFTDKGRRLAIEIFIDPDITEEAGGTPEGSGLKSDRPATSDAESLSQSRRGEFQRNTLANQGVHQDTLLARSSPTLQPTDYTEALGSVPLNEEYRTPTSIRLDGLSELLGLFGFGLTRAGRLIAINRWTEGRSDVEVALEVLVASLAHATRLKLTRTTDLDVNAVAQLIESIKEVFRPFVKENLLNEQILTNALTLMRGFTLGTVTLSELDHYLDDPLRGVAPPATCPDSIYVLVNAEDQ